MSVSETDWSMVFLRYRHRGRLKEIWNDYYSGSLVYAVDIQRRLNGFETDLVGCGLTGVF